MLLIVALFWKEVEFGKRRYNWGESRLGSRSHHGFTILDIFRASLLKMHMGKYFHLLYNFVRHDFFYLPNFGSSFPTLNLWWFACVQKCNYGTIIATLWPHTTGIHNSPASCYGARVEIMQEPENLLRGRCKKEKKKSVSFAFTYIHTPV